MLSILIPTYNQDITKLVCELHRQASEQFIEFEVIVLEDGSEQFVAANNLIEGKGNCRHIVLNKNIGRSASRNKLAKEAQYEHLLFMDCDAEVCSDYYIEKYLTFCKEEYVIAIGGTAYDPHEMEPQYSLRLAYGRKREARHANERSKNNFATFNFLISKKIFESVQFDETIKGYGHEDMLFGHQIHELGYEFTQIENPLIHKGLDNNIIFIQKTEEATKNLYLLYKTEKYPFLSQESTLLNTFLKVNRLSFQKPLAICFDIFATAIKKQLACKQPSLLLFDIYKLLFMCKVSTQK